MARKQKPEPLALPEPDGQDTRQLNIKIPAAVLQRLEELCEFRNVGKSALVREGIDDLYARHLQRTLTPAELSLLGDEHVIALKWKAVDLARWRKGPCMIAHELGVTRKTVETWLQTDGLFRELVQDAWDYTNELEVHTLFRKGQDEGGKGQLTALFGGLNNLDERFGLIKREYLEKNNRQLEEEFLQSVRPYVSRDVLHQIAADYRKRLAAKVGQ